MSITFPGGPGTVRVASAPVPSGDATGVTDTATLLAAVAAATAAGQTVVFGDATYVVNAEIAFTCSYQMTANTVIKAASGYTGTLASTPKGTLVSDLVCAGGVFDANNTAAHAFWVHQATHCSWVGAPIFRNATVEDLTIGDPTDSAFTSGNFFERPQMTRTVGGRADGSVALHLTTFATDNEIILARGSGQETGVWDEGNDNTVTGHYSNSPVQSFRYDGNNGRMEGFKPDTPKSLAHAAASASSGTSTITDTRVYAQHQGLPVASGGGIPAGCYVGTVTPLTSFVLVDKSGNPVVTTGTVTGVTFTPVGFNLQGTKESGVALRALNALYGTANGTGDSGTGFAVCVGPAMTYVRLDSPKLWSQDSSHQWAGLMTGLVSGVEWTALQEIRSVSPQNIVNKTNTVQQVSGLATTGSSVATQAITSGTVFTPNTTRDVQLTIPVATSSSGTITVTMGTSTGAENSILSANPVVAGQVLTLRVPQAWKVVVTLASCTLGTVTRIAA